MLDAYAAFGLPEQMLARSFPPLVSSAPGANTVFRTWDTADGHVVGLVIRDAEFHALCAALGREDLERDERFASSTSRFANFDKMVEVLAAEIRKLPTREFVERARKLGAPFAPVQTVDEFLADAQTLHNEIAVECPDPRFEDQPTRYLRHPVRYERTPASLRRHPPRLGEHTDEVLAEAGYSEAEIGALRESEAIR